MSTIDERIEELIAVTETHVLLMASPAALFERNTHAIARLVQSVETLVNVATNQQAVQEQHQLNFNTMLEAINRNSDDTRMMQSEVREMQAEIRGLQTENRRILDQLINPGET